jgi:hypothetical protein
MFIVPPIVLALLIQKRLKYAVGFGIVCIAAAVLYVYHIDTGRIAGENVWNGLGIRIVNTFAFAGCSVFVPNLKYAAPFLGVCCTVVYLWGLWKGLLKGNLVLYAGMAFLLLSAVAVAVGNPPILDSESVAAWRYRTYGSLVLVMTILLIFENIDKLGGRKIAYAITAMTLIFSTLSTVYCYRKCERRYEAKLMSAYNWHNKGEQLGSRYPAIESMQISELKQAEQLGIYTMPAYDMRNYTVELYKTDSLSKIYTPDQITWYIENVKQQNDFLILNGWAYLTDDKANMESQNVILYLVGNHSQLACQPVFERRFDVVDDTRKADCGFFAVIHKKNLPKEILKIEIGIQSRLNPWKPILCVKTNQEINL